MATETKAQIGMEDRIVSNSELLALLEEREHLKEGAAVYRAKDKAAKEAIIKLGEEPPYRIGRFLITKKSREARTVEFEIQAGESVRISNTESKDG